MKPQVTQIVPDDFHHWDEFAEYASDDLSDDWGAFTVNIGLDPCDPGEVYGVVVATPAAIPRIKQEWGRPFKGLVINQFDSESVKQAIEGYVSQVTAISWEEVRRHLQKVMTWEYEGV